MGGKIDISLSPRFVLTFTLTDFRYIAYILWKGSGRSGFGESQADLTERVQHLNLQSDWPGEKM